MEVMSDSSSGVLTATRPTSCPHGCGKSLEAASQELGLDLPTLLLWKEASLFPLGILMVTSASFCWLGQLDDDRLR